MLNGSFLKTYTLPELFDGTFKILKTTWKNTLLISALCFLPLSALFSISLNIFIGRVLESTSFNVFENIQRISPLLSSILLAALFFILIFLIATIFTRAVIVLNTFQVAHKKETTLKELVITVFREKLGKLLLQTLLIIAFFYILILLGGTIIGIFSLIIKSLPFSNIILTIIYIAFIGFNIWFFISFSFVVEIMIYEDITVVKSIIRSFNLVKSNWWRILGIIVITNIALFFAISIISGPIIFFTMAPSSAKFLETSLVKNSEFDYITSILMFYKNANISLGISMFIQNILSFLIMPTFMSLFFIDIKSREENKLKYALSSSESVDSSSDTALNITQDKTTDEE